MRKPLPPHVALRAARRIAGLTQTELAEKAGCTTTWFRTVEAGAEPSDELKRRIAAALNYSVWAIWPSARVLTDRFRILDARHGARLKIPEDEIAAFKEVVFRMTDDDFEDLIMSGTTPKDARRLIRTWAKEHDIIVVK